eukprot:scaffold24450_cov122-Cylindrotheca_fusiformis.AAC.1
MDNAALDMPVRLKAEDVEPYSSGLALLVDQITPTCQMVQAYLSSIPANTQECSSLVDELLVGQCGCPGNVTKDDDDDEVELCQVCPGMNDIFGVPERDVTGLVKTLGADILFPSSDNITCSNLYEDLSSTPANHLLCQKPVKSFFQGVCECPWSRQDRRCAELEDCSNSSSFKPDLRLDYLTEAFGYPFPPTCQQLVWMMKGVSENEQQCFGAAQFAHICGCGIRRYLGATTEGEQAALAWTLRMAGLLSAIGSSLILWDVFVGSKKKNGNRRLTMLHQLVCGMSLFDVFGSIANMFSTLPIPEYIHFESSSTTFPTGVYGAKGNSGTCAAQGFFVQLGHTSAFYNLVLSVYYVLVIKKGMRETQLQRLKYWFHVPALLVGFGLAFAGIPYYENIFLLCHIPPDVELSSWTSSGVEPLSITRTDSNGLLTIFSIAPISVVFIVGGVNMIVIYLHVRKQDRAANRWRMGHRLAQHSADAPPVGKVSSSWTMRSIRPKAQAVPPSNRLSNEVWWQALFYMGSFLMAWPIYYYARFSLMDLWGNFPFWVACCAMYPLQGFWNAIVFFRPRLFRYFRKGDRDRSSISNKNNCDGEGASKIASFGNVVTNISESNSAGQGIRNKLHQDLEGNPSVLREEEGLPVCSSRIDMTGSSIDSFHMESINES